VKRYILAFKATHDVPIFSFSLKYISNNDFNFVTDDMISYVVLYFMILFGRRAFGLTPNADIMYPWKMYENIKFPHHNIFFSEIELKACKVRVIDHLQSFIVLLNLLTECDYLLLIDQMKMMKKTMNWMRRDVKDR
jgi:hypothetical protein